MTDLIERGHPADRGKLDEEGVIDAVAIGPKSLLRALGSRAGNVERGEHTMSEPLRISAKNLGALALPGFCP